MSTHDKRIFSVLCIFGTFIAVAWYALAGCGAQDAQPFPCDVCRHTVQTPDGGPDAGNYW